MRAAKRLACRGVWAAQCLVCDGRRAAALSVSPLNSREHRAVVPGYEYTGRACRLPTVVRRQRIGRSDRPNGARQSHGLAWASTLSRRAMSVFAVSVAGVKQVIKVRMLPTREHAAALDATLRTCNGAASWLSAAMHAASVRGKGDVQRRFYVELKRRFGLSAQSAIRVIGKVADAYAALRANIEAGNCGPPGSAKRKKVQETPIGFRADAAQPFDARCLSWQIPDTVGGWEATVSIWTTRGRLKGIRVLAAPHDGAAAHTPDRRNRSHLPGRQVVSVRHHRRPGAAAAAAGQWVRRGGHGHCQHRYHQRRRPRRRGQVEPLPQTPAAITETLAGQENQFGAPVAQEASSQGVAVRRRPQPSTIETHRGRGATHRARYRRRTAGRDPCAVQLRKPQGAALHSWAFAQLGGFLGYKAQAAGVAFVEVDPAYTSQTCSACGWVDKHNRRSQAAFECGRCGFVGHADHNAAFNIAHRGVERWGEVMRPHAAPTLTAS